MNTPPAALTNKITGYPTTKWKWSFAKVNPSGVDTDFATVKQTGSGMAVSQSAGNLVVTTDPTAIPIP